jgi:hypothetical protein
VRHNGATGAWLGGIELPANGLVMGLDAESRDLYVTVDEGHRILRIDLTTWTIEREIILPGSDAGSHLAVTIVPRPGEAGTFAMAAYYYDQFDPVTYLAVFDDTLRRPVIDTIELGIYQGRFFNDSLLLVNGWRVIHARIDSAGTAIDTIVPLNNSTNSRPLILSRERVVAHGKLFDPRSGATITTDTYLQGHFVQDDDQGSFYALQQIDHYDLPTAEGVIWRFNASTGSAVGRIGFELFGSEYANGLGILDGGFIVGTNGDPGTIRIIRSSLAP